MSEKPKTPHIQSASGYLRKEKPPVESIPTENNSVANNEKEPPVQSVKEGEDLEPTPPTPKKPEGDVSHLFNELRAAQSDKPSIEDVPEEKPETTQE